ncbi:MAG: hypothetical protein EBW42_12095 [Rhodobacterales bacterium]|nr:hypothetical protein [Rhodobacterales bacterium]
MPAPKTIVKIIVEYSELNDAETGETSIIKQISEHNVVYMMENDSILSSSEETIMHSENSDRTNFDPQLRLIAEAIWPAEGE